MALSLGVGFGTLFGLIFGPIGALIGLAAGAAAGVALERRGFVGLRRPAPGNDAPGAAHRRAGP